MLFHGVDYRGTCSCDNPKNNHLTYARNRSYLERVAEKAIKNSIFVGICVPPKVGIPPITSPEIQLRVSEFFDYEFTLFHNAVNKGKFPYYLSVQIGENCDIAATSFLGGEGVHVAIGPGGVKAHLKHIGGIVIEDDVYIGPMTLVQRGTFDSTIIKKGVKIDSNVIVGHNSVIGENSVLSHCTLGGSVKIGKNCWIGMGVVIKNGVSICDNVMVGQMANVVKDITEPGVYVGNPARKVRELREGENF